MKIYSKDDGSNSEEEYDGRKKGPCSISSSGSSSKSVLAAASFKLIFPNRFPLNLWTNARDFLTSNQL